MQKQHKNINEFIMPLSWYYLLCEVLSRTFSIYSDTWWRFLHQ